MITVSDQDLVLAYKCNDVIDFSLSRGESIDGIDADHTVSVICTEYTSEPFKEIMADHIKLMNDYPMNGKVKS